MSELVDAIDALATGDTSNLPNITDESPYALQCVGYMLGTYPGPLKTPVHDLDKALYQLAMTGGGGSDPDVTALRQQIATLQAENASLQGQVSALTVENTALQTEAESALDEINGEVIE